MNRGICDCRTYTVDTERYIDDLYDGCNCKLPCNSCECVDMTGSCPPCLPTPPNEPSPPPQCVPVKCFPDKPKKSFWQFLFGDKKGSLCSKKKLDCDNGKSTKKERCKPYKQNQCKETPELQSKRPVCESKSQNSEACPRKGCIPTKYSVFGGHFYMNVENRPRGCPRTVAKTTKCCHLLEGDNTAKNGNDVASRQLYFDYDISETLDGGNQAGNLSYKTKHDSLDTGGSMLYRKPLMNSHVQESERNKLPYEVSLSKGTTERNKQPSAVNPSKRDTERTKLPSTVRPSKETSERNRLLSTVNPASSQRKRWTETSVGNNDHQRSSALHRQRTSFANIPEKRSSNRDSCRSDSPNKTSLGHDLPRECPSKKDVCINLTVTKEETQYFLPNKTAMSSCPDEVSSCDSKDIINTGSKQSSEQVITLEINKNGLKLSGKECKDVGPSEEHNSQLTIDDVEEPAPKDVPRSESFAREVGPLLKKKAKQASLKTLDINKCETPDKLDLLQSRSKLRPSNCRRSSNNNLDQRFLEILLKLNDIEKKISCIEQKEQENKGIRVDFDNKKSTVSLHIKDPGIKEKKGANEFQVFKCSTSPKNGSNNTPTVIEIRQNKSKKSSSFRDLLENEPNIIHQSEKTSHSNQTNNKIVIKIPSINRKTRCVVLPEDTSTKKSEKCKSLASWYDIADDLKNTSNTGKCYCCECHEKRVG